MKNIIILVLVLISFYGCVKCNKVMSDNAYNSCIAEGKQSKDVCYYYAYVM